MLERLIVERVRKRLRETHGATVHKYHGGFGGETSHSDLYGTLPPEGRAFFIECKSPDARKDAARTERQRVWMEAEKANGAATGFATCEDDVDRIIEDS